MLVCRWKKRRREAIRSEQARCGNRRLQLPQSGPMFHKMRKNSIHLWGFPLLKEPQRSGRGFWFLRRTRPVDPLQILRGLPQTHRFSELQAEWKVPRAARGSGFGDVFNARRLCGFVLVGFADVPAAEATMLFNAVVVWTNCTAVSRMSCWWNW